MRDKYWLAEDCPYCGQKDSEGAWKGARMGSTRWGHSYSCCSEECGQAFLNSEQHIKLEIEKIDWQIEALKTDKEHWIKLQKINPKQSEAK